jgi:hypothetical protein
MLSQLSFEVAALSTSLQIDFLQKALMLEPSRTGELEFAEQPITNEEE